MTDIMLDLETLSTAEDAVILSIGAVKFIPDTDEIVHEFYVELTEDIDVQLSNYRDINFDTICWWMQQDERARSLFDKTANAESQAKTAGALQSFAEFMCKDKDVRVWGNSPSFDNAILGSLYKDMQMDIPWNQYNNRCFRTLRRAFPDIELVREGTFHNALDDAITQAKHVQKIMRYIKQANISNLI